VKSIEMPAKLVLVPLGTIERELLVGIGKMLREVFGPTVVLAPAQDRPGYAFNKDRNQYHTTAILRRLSQTPRTPASAPVLGVTDVDLFVPDAPYVFGEADRASQVAVVSQARLATGPDGRHTDPGRLARRLQVESVHELGHLLGLSHCQDVHCAMLLSHKATDADRKGPGLCVSCRSALGLG
jgi:archaemetzincin